MKRARGRRARTEQKASKKTRAPKQRKKLNGKTVLKSALITIGALIAVAIIALGLGFVDESDLMAPIDRESGKINALILGTDEGGLRTDTIMVASFDLDTAEINMLSIPRDTKLYVKNRKLTRKITEVHAMSAKDGKGTITGPIGSTEAVTQLTGIPINYYIEFSFDAVEDILNTLGPITYDVPDVEGGGKGMNYDDPAQDLHIHLKPGVQELDGEQLVHLMRYRHGDSDFKRMERQQNVIKAVVEQKLNASLILKAPKLYSQFKNEISTNLSSGDFAKYVKYLGDLSSDKIHSYQLPGESQHLKSGWYFVCDLEATKTLISETFGFDASNITTDVEIYGEGSQAKAIINNKKTTSTSETKATAAPKATAKPKSSPQTKATAQPKQTAAPAKATSEPKATPAPEKTAEPKATQTPAATKKPESTPDAAKNNENNDDNIISLD